MAEKACHTFASAAQVGLTQALGPTIESGAIRKINAIVLFVAVAISLGIVATGITASHARNALLSVNWFVWLLFVTTYPFAVLQSGFVTGTEPGSISHRKTSPARFWTGLVATTLFWAVLLGVVSLYSVMAWYRGA